MKKKIDQHNGVNQVALVNSNDNEITIINSPIEHMTWLIRKGKIEEASELFAKIYKEAEKMHPLYPSYIYKPVELGSKIVFKHHPSNKKIADQLPLKYKGKFSIKDRDILQGETIREFLTRKYYSQERVSIDMKYIETWIGEHLIDDPFSFEKHAINEGEWFILPGKLPPPIKAKLVLIEDEKDRVIIDYLELRVTEVSNKENKIIISNIHQESSPIELSLTISNIFTDKQFVESTSKFDIKIRENFEWKVIAEKTFLEFMKFVKNSSKIRFVEIESQKVFFTAEGINLNNPQDSKYTDGRIEVLAELSQIENALGVQFHLPEFMEEEDFKNIEILKAIIDGKEIITEIDNFNAVFDNREALQKIVNDIKDRPIMVTGQEELVIELFGVKFESIRVSHTFENLVVKNPERIRKKLEYLDDGETAKVEFIPGTKNTVKTRYRMPNR
ncbi:rRNA maturation protein Rpf1 [Gracilibacillus halotolerans]|uniref:rRNA maturation protein Rpf1 n=1 Tax=Gracilibacillus halotolerans TaxID=74386 RepID=A0A841RTZ0_9BACI|nr:hypothetical protein [Gracilibacillus halotolerans]MBB6514414.1 rRNA maturation protein Rpf1 [Gracilibacillus halotolerans]